MASHWTQPTSFWGKERGPEVSLPMSPNCLFNCLFRKRLEVGQLCTVCVRCLQLPVFSFTASCNHALLTLSVTQNVVCLILHTAQPKRNKLL